MTTVHVLSRTVRVLLFEDATVQRCREASANTVLMMMNGIGPVGTLDGPDSFLKPLSEMFKPGGQILVDYGDIRHRQVVTGTGGLDWPARTGDYIGEAWIRLEYLGQVGEPFRELYVDFDTLKERSNRSASSAFASHWEPAQTISLAWSCGKGRCWH